MSRASRFNGATSMIEWKTTGLEAATQRGGHGELQWGHVDDRCGRRRCRERLVQRRRFNGATSMIDVEDTQ